MSEKPNPGRRRRPKTAPTPPDDSATALLAEETLLAIRRYHDTAERCDAVYARSDRAAGPESPEAASWEKGTDLALHDAGAAESLLAYAIQLWRPDVRNLAQIHGRSPSAMTPRAVIHGGRLYASIPSDATLTHAVAPAQIVVLDLGDVVDLDGGPAR